MKEFLYYKNNSPSKSSIAVLLNPCYYTVKLYRISRFFYKKRIIFLAKIFWFLNRIIFCVDIDYRAKIGENFMLIHGIGTVIGCNVKIGNNVKIYQGVTLGGCGRDRTYMGKIIDQPIIGDNSIIYTNSCIFGPVIISPNSKIKACQIITSDI